MGNTSKLTPLLTFSAFLFAFIVLGRMGSIYILDHYTDDYTIHSSFDIIMNIILGLISYYFIKKYELIELAGLRKNKKLLHIGILLFPLYLVALNASFADEITSSNLLRDIIVLTGLCLSIGFSEELALRGFLQSYLIKNYATTQKQLFWSLLGAALIFGILHLVKFDKGIYGELSQVAFATFIGVMFGAILLRTKRLWPLIVLHALIDFAAKIDTIGTPFTLEISKPTSLSSAIVIALLVLPCFLFGWLILRKKSYEMLVA